MVVVFLVVVFLLVDAARERAVVDLRELVAREVVAFRVVDFVVPLARVVRVVRERVVRRGAGASASSVASKATAR